MPPLALPGLVGWLGAVLATMILLSAIPVAFLDPPDGVECGGDQNNKDNCGILNALWLTVLRAMDPGTIGGDAGGSGYLAIMFAVTLGGIFIFSALVGVIAIREGDRVIVLAED